MREGVQRLFKDETRIEEDAKPKPVLTVIWKSNISIVDEQRLMLPHGDIRPLFADLDPQGLPAIWYKADSKWAQWKERQEYLVTIIGTGQHFDNKKVGMYVGSFKEGRGVWHVFLKMVES